MSMQSGGIPATMGRRVGARAIDASISFFFLAVLNVSATAVLMGGGDGGGFLVVLFALFGVWAAFSLWSIFARAALPGQLVLGLHHIDSQTGQRAGGKTFLKYLVQGCTFGFALLITPLSIQAPNRSWFDRLAGVTLLDGRHVAADDATARVSAPPAGWQAEESHLTQAGLLDEPVTSAPPGPGGLIQAVPLASGLPSLDPQAPPAVARPVGAPVAAPSPHLSQQPLPQPVVRAAPSAPIGAPVVVLDDGRRFPLTRVLLVGRAPRPSAGMGDAQVVTLDDQSVSANHLAVGVDQDGPWVMDLRSSNGSWLQQDGAAELRLEPMQRVALSPGAALRVGQRRMTAVSS